MKPFTAEDLKKLEKLARIACTKEEEEAFLKAIPSVLSHIESLNEVDTRNLSNLEENLQENFHLLREDTPEKAFSRETLLKNTPEEIGGMVKIPPVIHF